MHWEHWKLLDAASCCDCHFSIKMGPSVSPVCWALVEAYISGHRTQFGYTAGWEPGVSGSGGSKLDALLIPVFSGDSALMLFAAAFSASFVLELFVATFFIGLAFITVLFAGAFFACVGLVLPASSRESSIAI
jgi:hypothetical protein